MDRRQRRRQRAVNFQQQKWMERWSLYERGREIATGPNWQCSNSLHKTTQDILFFAFARLIFTIISNIPILINCRSIVSPSLSLSLPQFDDCMYIVPCAPQCVIRSHDCAINTIYSSSWATFSLRSAVVSPRDWICVHVCAFAQILFHNLIIIECVSVHLMPSRIYLWNRETLHIVFFVHDLWRSQNDLNRENGPKCAVNEWDRDE